MAGQVRLSAQAFPVALSSYSWRETQGVPELLGEQPAMAVLPGAPGRKQQCPMRQLTWRLTLCPAGQVSVSHEELAWASC